MKISEIKESLYRLFKKHYNFLPTDFTQLAQSGSDRKYYRITGNNKTAIGVYNPNIDENKAFFAYTKAFEKEKINVPELYYIDESNLFYLIQDLGDTTLFDLLPNFNTTDYVANLKLVVDGLIKIQVDTPKHIDYNVSLNQKGFNKDLIIRDLNYFKYYFLKPSGFIFNEDNLDESFNELANSLTKNENKYFMFRDFQSRNIMWHNNEPWFIDYQGGMQGPLQYDLASLLFQAKAQIPYIIRREILDYYTKQLSTKINIDIDDFNQYFYDFALVRLLQTLGAYGYRGVIERKGHFLQSIPYALKNLKWLLEGDKLSRKESAFTKLLHEVADTKQYNHTAPTDGKLTVYVNSFSYKKKFPHDWGGNGGGFFFDCRALTNPGRYIEYKHLNGMDEPVQTFLKQSADIQPFIDKTMSIVNGSVKRYLERGFTSLQVNYGCTGGQHRSVYCAEQAAKELKQNPNIIVVVNHIEQQ